MGNPHDTCPTCADVSYDFESLNLEFVKFSKNTLIPQDISAEIHVSSGEQAVISLVAYFLGRKVHQETHSYVSEYVDYPATWWDAFREAMGLQWERWPIKTVKRPVTINTTITITNVCPHIDRKFSMDQRPHIVFLRDTVGG